ncbi:MAG TPA: tetratricopeptide repeat protein [Candidatus Didemnitutus sp.]|nr:tetratricopeptide repeat protein [Candidatus Didemnitutus sp.]
MRRLSLFALPALGLALLLTSARADLVWAPGTGWHIEGGAIAAVSGPEGRTALDLMNKARQEEEAHHWHAALKNYKRVAIRYGTSVYAAEALFRVGLIYQQKKEYFAAFDTYQALLGSYPSSQKFTQVVAEQYRIASQLLDGARPRIWGWIPGFRNRERAVEYFERIIANAPYSDYAPMSLMNVAKGQRIIGGTEEAIDALDRMINTYSRSVLTPDAYLKLADAYASLVAGPNYDQESTRLAVTYYEDYLILFPGDTGAAEAERGLAKMKNTLAQSKMILADYYFKYRKNYKAARVFYNEAITVYPDSDVAAKAKVKLAKVDAILNNTPPPADTTPAAPKKKKKWLGLF